MNGQTGMSISAIATALMLVGCASKGTVSSTETAPAGAGTQDQTSAEYKRVIENASNQLICQRHAVTGSRVYKQVCLTRADMEEQRRRADEAMREMRESAVSRSSITERPEVPPRAPRRP